MQRIDINLQISRIFKLGLCVLTIASVVITLFLPFNMWIKFSLIGLESFYSFFIFNKYILMINPRSVLGLFVNAEGWFTWDKSQCYKIQILGESTVTSFITVLRFKIEDNKKTQSLIIFNDAVKKDIYRKFIVKLRTEHSLSKSACLTRAS